jgi:hypothetical protein
MFQSGAPHAFLHVTKFLGPPAKIIDVESPRMFHAISTQSNHCQASSKGWKWLQGVLFSPFLLLLGVLGWGFVPPVFVDRALSVAGIRGKSKYCFDD